jgi:hypothetical protein
MTINYIESFPTIDQCVDFLVKIGCEWSYEKEQELKKKCLFQYEDTIVYYDPFNILKLD